MSFFDELKRRNVVRVGVAYAVAAWLLIQVSDIVFPRVGLPDSAVTLVIMLLGIGFIPVLVFSWAFEITPEGIKREGAVDHAQTNLRVAGKKLDRLIILMLAVVVAWFLVDEFYLEPNQVAQVTVAATDTPPAAQPATVNSVAVLPFRAMSSGEDDEYFADGLTEEILNSLTQLPELLVTARTSSFFFKGQDLPIPEIAARLAVANVVEGSVRRSGDRIRVTAQLIRAADGFHLWSNTYDRTLEDVFKVQEDIAVNIAETLDVVLDESKRELMRNAGIGDVDAFIAYQKGMEQFLAAHQSIDDISGPLRAASELFDQALAVSPDLVAARIFKADAPGHVLFELSAGFRDEAFPGEEQQALESLREEYDLAWQRSPRGNQRDILDLERAIFNEDWSSMPGKIQRAMQPGDCPELNWSAELLITHGHADAIEVKSAETLRCDPFHALASFYNAYAQLWTGNFAGAEQSARAAKAKGLNFSWLDLVITLSLLARSDLDAPETTFKGSPGLIRFPLEILRYSLLGDAQEAQRVARAWLASPAADDWSSLVVAAVIGDRDLANQLAAQIDQHPGGFLVLSNAIFVCLCGAPFDADVTPNFKARSDQAGFSWPPPTVIHYPAKTW